MRSKRTTGQMLTAAVLYLELQWYNVQGAVCMVTWKA